MTQSLEWILLRNVSKRKTYATKSILIIKKMNVGKEFFVLFVKLAQFILIAITTRRRVILSVYIVIHLT